MFTSRVLSLGLIHIMMNSGVCWGNPQSFPLGYSMMWRLQVCTHTNGYNLLRLERKICPTGSCLLVPGLVYLLWEVVELSRGELCPGWQRLVTIQSPVLSVCRLTLCDMQHLHMEMEMDGQSPKPWATLSCFCPVFQSLIHFPYEGSLCLYVFSLHLYSPCFPVLLNFCRQQQALSSLRK